MQASQIVQMMRPSMNNSASMLKPFKTFPVTPMPLLTKSIAFQKTNMPAIGVMSSAQLFEKRLKRLVIRFKKA